MIGKLVRFPCGCVGIPLEEKRKEECRLLTLQKALVFSVCDAGTDGYGLTATVRDVQYHSSWGDDVVPLSDEEVTELVGNLSRQLADGERFTMLKGWMK